MSLPLLVGAASAEAQPLIGAITPVDDSSIVGVTSTQLAAAATSTQPRTYFRIDVVTSGSPTIFCTYDGTTPTAYGIGSHPFTGLGSGEEDASSRGDVVPQGAIKCVAASGTVGVTVKVYPQ